MKGRVPRVVLAGKSRADRRAKRAGIRLKDFTISSKTKARYEAAVARILPYLEQQSSLVEMDSLVVEWIEAQWISGEALTYVLEDVQALEAY